MTIYAYLCKAISTVDLVLTRKESYILHGLHFSAVLSVGLSFHISMLFPHSLILCLIHPSVCLSHGLWVLYMTHISQPTNDGGPYGHLPARFRQIMYIDCLAWKKLDSVDAVLDPIEKLAETTQGISNDEQAEVEPHTVIGTERTLVSIPEVEQSSGSTKIHFFEELKHRLQRADVAVEIATENQTVSATAQKGGASTDQPVESKFAREVKAREKTNSEESETITEYAQEISSVIEHYCELIAYVDTWKLSSEPNESETVTNKIKVVSRSNKGDSGEAGLAGKTLRSRAGRKGGQDSVAESSSMSSRREEALAAGRARVANLNSADNGPDDSYVRDMLSVLEPTARLSKTLTFNSSGGKPRSSLGSVGMSNIGVGDTDVQDPMAGITREDLLGYRKLLREFEKQILNLLTGIATVAAQNSKGSSGSSDSSIFASKTLRAFIDKKRSVAQWVLISDYDESSGVFLPYFVYVDGQTETYTVPDTPFMTQGFIRSGLDTLQKNLSAVEDNLKMMGWSDKILTGDKSPETGPNEQFSIRTEAGAEGDKAIKSAEMLEKPVVRRRKILADRFRKWLNSKAEMYEAPDIVSEIETLKSTATKADLLPLALFRRAMTVIALVWFIGFLSQCIHQEEGYRKFIYVPKYDLVDPVSLIDSDSPGLDSTAIDPDNDLDGMTFYEFEHLACSEKCGIDKIVLATKYQLLRGKNREQNQCINAINREIRALSRRQRSQSLGSFERDPISYDEIIDVTIEDNNDMCLPTVLVKNFIIRCELQGPDSVATSPGSSTPKSRKWKAVPIRIEGTWNGHPIEAKTVAMTPKSKTREYILGISNMLATTALVMETHEFDIEAPGIEYGGDMRSLGQMFERLDGVLKGNDVLECLI